MDIGNTINKNMKQQEIDDMIRGAEMKLESFLEAEFPEVNPQFIYDYIDDIAPIWMSKGLDVVLKKLLNFKENKISFTQYMKGY